MTVRPARPGDETGIHSVHASSFPTEAEAGLVTALRKACRLRVSVVAEVDGILVGHAALSPVETEAEPTGGLGFGPVAVVPSRRGQGIGMRLVLAALAAAREAGAGYVVVLGDPAYYRRFGFRPASEKGLDSEFGGGPSFQVMELKPGALPRGPCRIRYAPEFASLGERDGQAGS